MFGPGNPVYCSRQIVRARRIAGMSYKMLYWSCVLLVLFPVMAFLSCTPSPVHNKSVPVLSIQCQPADWDPYTGRFHLNSSYQGTSAPVNASTLYVTVNGTPVTSQLTIDTDAASGTMTGLNVCDGVNVFATIQDNSGALTSASCSLPALVINYPANGSTINDPLPGISMVYDPRTTNTGFTVTMDTVAMTSLCSSGVSTGTVCQQPMGEYITPPGTHSISVHRCFAGGAPCCDKSSSFTFVPPVPQVSILSPSGYIGSGSAGVSLLFSDTTNLLGLDTGTYTVLLDGNNVTGSLATLTTSTLTGFPSTPTSFTAQGSVGIGSQPTHSLQASVTNLFYSTTGTAVQTFSLDTTPPSLQFLQPVSGSTSGGTAGTVLPYFIYPSATIPYEVTYSDTQSGVNPSSFAITASGAPGTVSATGISATGTVPVTLPVSSGSDGSGTYTMTAQVSDNVGNTGFANSVITLSLANIGIGGAVVSPATTFTVPINTFIDPSHAYGLGSYDIAVSFNQSVVSFVSVAGSLSGYPGVLYAPEFYASPNYYQTVSGIDINASTSAGGGFTAPVGLFNLANLTFYAVSAGTTTLTITVNAFRDTTGAALPANRVQSGTVTVQ